MKDEYKELINALKQDKYKKLLEEQKLKELLSNIRKEFGETCTIQLIQILYKLYLQNKYTPDYYSIVAVNKNSGKAYSFVDNSSWFNIRYPVKYWNTNIYWTFHIENAITFNTEKEVEDYVTALNQHFVDATSDWEYKAIGLKE